MSTALGVDTQILEHVVMADREGMSPESARALLELRFDAHALERMNQLAEKNRLGTIQEAERQELDGYLRVGNLLNVLQAKARLALPPSG